MPECPATCREYPHCACGDPFPMILNTARDVTRVMYPEARIPETPMAAPTSDLYRYSVEAALKKEREKIAGLRQSLEALKKQDGDYADAHRRLLAMHEEIVTVILRHLP